MAIRNTAAQSPRRRRTLADLRRDSGGSATLMMAAGLFVAIGSLGGAIDIGRMYMVKTQLQAGVDAAALAGARAFGVTDNSANSRVNQVNSYFDGNFPRSPAYMGTTNVTVLPTFEVVDNVTVTTVRATATLGMTFMRVFGATDKTLTATATAELQPRPLEVMVVLDNTGSMRFNLSGGKTRITALKESANSFVNILFQGGNQRKDLALGFVPYDVTVNVGNLLLSRLPNSVARVDGFNSGAVASGGGWPSNPYYWKGCVMNDPTVRDVSDNRLVSEPGAWDVDRTLPGEGAHPAVQPFFVPPLYVPRQRAQNGTRDATAAQKADNGSDFYRIITDGEQRNNLFRVDRSFGGGPTTYLANSAAYRSWFYDYYVGLNVTASDRSNDVIRALDGSFYNPGSGNRGSTNWYVDVGRIPGYYGADWAASPANATVNANGGRYDNVNADTTPMQTPNWQCPEEAMLPLYDRSKSAYTDYIRDKNAAIYPGNGTIHHSGLLWAYRLLVRDDVFQRPRPSGMTLAEPRRAIVFMTDGLNEVGEDQNNYLNRTFTWYGRWSDGGISADPAGAETQMLRRFAKTCANIQRDGGENAPLVYIIALVANSAEVNDAFDDCAPGRVYRTSNAAQLNAAFQNVAAELVDLHLTQ